MTDGEIEGVRIDTERGPRGIIGLRSMISDRQLEDQYLSLAQADIGHLSDRHLPVQPPVPGSAQLGLLPRVSQWVEQARNPGDLPPIRPVLQEGVLL